MHRAYLPKALALTVLAAGLTFAGAQQTQPTPDANAPQTTAPEGPHHHAPNPQREARMLSRRLGLTPDQTARIEPILADRAQKMEALHQNQQLAPQDRHQQMRAIHESTEQQLSSVLTPDQMTQLKAMHHHGHDRSNSTGEAPTQSPS